MSGAGKVLAAAVDGAAVRAPGMVAGKVGGAGALGLGDWPWTAAIVMDWAPLPEPPRGGNAAPPPPPSECAGCQGAEMPAPSVVAGLAEKARLSGRPLSIPELADVAGTVASGPLARPPPVDGCRGTIEIARGALANPGAEPRRTGLDGAEPISELPPP